MSSFPNRMIRAAKLDVNLYEEAKAERQAMRVVVPASLAAGIGSAVLLVSADSCLEPSLPLSGGLSGY